ncbi:Receptor-type tyrosine-protein phosphatase eta [Trichinella patagoniensis]|uniref:Receptor-type tyrosine-protein phosphatase eta n=1 Tax=Trichinella patagoniensis TaxID=990121 RepID=A0A0V0ZKD1_9BILA|nr:Receptor-type tyrosine-protein phosphatase eta [Trichinella patagoniensis]
MNDILLWTSELSSQVSKAMSRKKSVDKCSFQGWFNAMASMKLTKLSEQMKGEFEELQNVILIPHNHIEFSKNSTNGRVRYSDIPCLDISRVKLRFPVDGNDFIHANWVKLPHSPFVYIITQAPLEGTVSHFWSMVWHEEVRAVVCLAVITEQNELKDRPYWPVKPGENLESGEFSVQHVEKIMHNQLQITLLRLVNKSTDESRELSHYMFLNWPDHAPPTCTHVILEAMEIMEKNLLRENDKLPVIVVHCSAGVGRAGTFVCLNNLIHTADKNKPISIQAVVRSVRKQRALSVQSFPQYAFLYWALLVHMMKKDSSLKHVLEKSRKTVRAIKEWSTDSECVEFPQIKRKTVFSKFNRVKGMFSKMSLNKQKKH